MLILRPTDQYFDNLDESQFLLMNFFFGKMEKIRSREICSSLFSQNPTNVVSIPQYQK